MRLRPDGNFFQMAEPTTISNSALDMIDGSSILSSKYNQCQPSTHSKEPKFMTSKIIVTTLTLILLPATLSARTWTNDKGKSIQADFVRKAGEDHVVLKIKGKEHRIYIWSLSKEDRAWIEENKDAGPTTSADTSDDSEKSDKSNETKTDTSPPKKTNPKPSGDGAISATLLGVELKVGRNEIPMDTSEYDFSKDNIEHSKESKIILYLPGGFNPEEQYKLMFTSASSSGKAAQGGSIGPFGNVGIKNGWVVMTADSVKGRPPNFSMNYRLQMLDAAFDYMHAEWPASKTWKIAGAGHSGGAKCAQTLLMNLGSRTWGSHHVVGLLLSGCNECYLSVDRRSHSVGRSDKRKVAVYLSQGKKDTIAKPDSSKRVMETIKKEHGMRIQKYVIHDGGHSISREHVDEAFQWIGAHADALPMKTIK